nr:transposase, MuDR, MULE transposase domain protein [Tanacetum cinerariifolium]
METSKLCLLLLRHPVIALAVRTEFPLALHDVCYCHLMMNIALKRKKTKGLYWKICKACTPKEFTSNINILQAVQPDAYNKLIQAGPQRWSRAHCPLSRYNHIASNSVKSVNACIVLKRKLPITMLTETYRAMVQDCKSKLEIYIDHVGVNFIIAKYICPDATLAEMINHVITDYISDNEKKETPAYYTIEQMIEWAEQKHLENEETKEDRRHEAIRKNRQTLRRRLQSELEAEVTLANKLSCELTRVAEQMRSREIHMMTLHAMPIMSLNSYGLHTLLMTHESDIRTAHNLRLTVLIALQEAHDEESCLEEQMLNLMHRFADRFTRRKPEINGFKSLPDHLFIDYGRYALERMTESDMRNATTLKMARDELLRSMVEKQEFIKNYKEM